MAGKTLAAHVAELLSASLQSKDFDSTTLNHYKIQGPPGLCEEELPTIRAGQAIPAYDWDAENLKGYPRRGSVASTRASGSSDSAESEDFSDIASEVAAPVRISSDDLASLGASFLRGAGEPARSTLKIANIPRRCGKDELLAAIESVGFANSYDFFYLPLGPQSKKNHGYAFINFTDNETADRFVAVFSGFPIRAKTLDVMPAPLQGLTANIDHFSKTRATKCDWVPNVILKV